MKTLNFKKFFWLASLMLAFSFQFVSAETAIPENLAPLAQELGCQTKEECAKAFDSNFEKGIELAEKYQVYSKEQSDIAKSYKQEVISKLSGLSEENFEEEIVKIAKELLKKPKLAQSFQLDKDSVSAAETIVAEVKNAGVDVDICSQSAEALSREQLIGCLEASKKLAKKTSVQKYIPKGVIEKTNMADMAAGLDEALTRGDYPELGKTAEEAGQKCLKSGSESLKSCDEVAQKFFGPEGVKELAAARTQTKQAGDFYLKNLENMELITPDGRKIAGKTAIRNACDQAFETRDIKLARACGDFAVKNGFTGKEEMENSLKLFESMADKNINFDDCRSNPEICEEFIPEEHKQEFEGNKKIYEIMKAETGFNPTECERGNVDFEIGRKCFEASKKVLPKLKEIAKDYPEVQRMVSEIESGLKRETEQSQKGDDFGKFFSQQAGPGGCKNEQECFAYCNDPAHGAECISFGAKHEVFEGNEAVARYQKYNVNSGGYGEQGPSPECFAAIQSGDFAKAKEICSAPANPYQYQPPQYQQQKPLEQMINYQQSSASYPSSSFSSYSSYGSANYSSYSSYPSSSYSYSSPGYTGSCPSDLANLLGSGCHYMYNDSSGRTIYCNGEMTKSAKSGDTAITEGCVSTGNYSSYSYSSYNYTPPSGQKEQIWNNYGLRSWIRTDADTVRIENLKQVCASVTSASGNIWTPDAGNYQSVDFGMPDEAKCRSWTPGSQSSYSYSSYPSYSSCTTEMVSLLGSGCHFMYNDSSNTAVYCNGEMTKSAKLGDTTAKDGCQSTGGYSSYGSSYSSYSSYPSSAYSSYSYSSYNYPQCDWSTQYLKNSTQTCMPKTDCYNTANADYNSSECQGVRGSTTGYSSSYSSYSYNSASSCPTNLLGSGCHDMSSAYFNGAMDQYVNYGGSTVKNCATEYINGCTTGGSYSSYSSYPSSAYSSYSYSSYDYSTACAQAGGTWDGSYCQMPNTASSAAAYSSYSSAEAYSSPSYDPSSACAQAGGSWDGTSCQMPSSSSSSAETQNPAAAGWFLRGIINFFSR